MKHKIIFFLTLFLCGWLFSFAQEKELGFASYLIEKGAFEEMIQLNHLPNTGLCQAEIDSLNYFEGWAHFNLKNLPLAIDCFSKVTKDSRQRFKADLFRSWSQLYLGQTDLARVTIDQAFPHSQEEIELIRQQTQAIEDYQLAGQAIGKSYFLSALLSALVPGTGKIYAQEKGSGLSSLLISLGLGGIAAENIIKSGWTSWNGLSSLGIGVVFYVANIYGSLLSINTYRSRQIDQKRKHILAGVLLPYRAYERKGAN